MASRNASSRALSTVVLPENFVSERRLLFLSVAITHGDTVVSFVF